MSLYDECYKLTEHIAQFGTNTALALSEAQFSGIKIIPSTNLRPTEFIIVCGLQIWDELQLKETQATRKTQEEETNKG